MKKLIHVQLAYRNGAFMVVCPEYDTYGEGQNLPEAFERLGERLNEKVTEEERAEKEG